MSDLKKITKEELESIKQQQAKLQISLIDIGFIETKKHEAISVYVEATRNLEETKRELENVYGKVNIDLTDGSYTFIEEKELLNNLEKV